jgi:chorismate mutase / prephenate dehydratase
VSLSRKESVDALRKKIDQIDEKVVALLNDRASLALRIGHSKRLNNTEVYVPAREQEVLRRVCRLNRGPLSEQAIRGVFREVIGI